MIGLFARKPQARFVRGTRVITTRACPLGFFAKGQRGTVMHDDGDSCYLVIFDGAPHRWVGADEMRRIPNRRESIFQALAMAWLNLRGPSRPVRD